LKDQDFFRMSAVKLRLTLAVAGLLALAACIVMPHGFEAARLLAAQDDPVQLTDLALEKRFNRELAAAEIEAALAGGDVDLAQSVLDLADERGLPVDPALRVRLAAAASASAQVTRAATHFVGGFVGGEPHDLASLAGTVTGDLFVYGDIRDAVREAIRLARGESVDELVLGLACVGLAITAGTYATAGAGAPARVGVSLFKAASRAGRITPEMGQALVRPLREAVDGAALGRALSAGAWLQPAVAVRAVRDAVKIEKAQGLVRTVGDLGRVQAKAGARATLDGLRLAQGPKDVAQLARLAEAKGGKTRAVLKVLGRGAIALSLGAFNLASWMFWALLNLIALCAALKRSTERATMNIIRRRKARRLLAAQAGAYGPAVSQW
jgi:hypothetical protein